MGGWEGLGGVLTFSLETDNADKNHFAFQGEAV